VYDSEAPVAFALAESFGDGSRAVRVCMAAIRAIGAEYAGVGTGVPLYAKWIERGDKYARPGTADRARDYMSTGLVRLYAGDRQTGLKISESGT